MFNFYWLQKITGKELEYTSLVGKPCEITYRFAEDTVSKIAKRMGITRPLKRLYFFGWVLFSILYRNFQFLLL